MGFALSLNASKTRFLHLSSNSPPTPFYHTSLLLPSPTPPQSKTTARRSSASFALDYPGVSSPSATRMELSQAPRFLLKAA